MHFDGAFNLPGAGAGAVLTSPSGYKLCYAIQLFFKSEHKVSNNIAEYEGLLAGLRVASALGHQAPHRQRGFTTGFEILQQELHA
jgi:ribonuclease HI